MRSCPVLVEARHFALLAASEKAGMGPVENAYTSVSWHGGERRLGYEA